MCSGREIRYFSQSCQCGGVRDGGLSNVVREVAVTAGLVAFEGSGGDVDDLVQFLKFETVEKFNLQGPGLTLTLLARHCFSTSFGLTMR